MVKRALIVRMSTLLDGEIEFDESVGEFTTRYQLYYQFEEWRNRVLSASRTTWPLNSGVKFLRFRFAIGASFQVVEIIPQSWFREWPEFKGAVQSESESCGVLGWQKRIRRTRGEWCLFLHTHSRRLHRNTQDVDTQVAKKLSVVRENCCCAIFSVVSSMYGS